MPGIRLFDVERAEVLRGPRPEAERAAAAECRFYIHVAVERGLKPPTVDLPAAPEPQAVTALLMAMGECEDAEHSAAAAVLSSA